MRCVTKSMCAKSKGVREEGRGICLLVLKREGEGKESSVTGEKGFDVGFGEFFFA